jgi:hypothetical protein
MKYVELLLGWRSVSHGISLDMCRVRLVFQATGCKVDKTGKEIQVDKTGKEILLKQQQKNSCIKRTLT